MRVLLIYPNREKEIIGWGDLGAIAEPLALEYIASAAKAENVDVQILDLRLHPDLLEITLLVYQPDLIGVTGYSMHVLRNLSIMRTAKEYLPSVLTIVGGHHATLLPEDFFQPAVDFVVVGEGVHPFREVLRRLEQDQPIQEIAGVWSRVEGEFRFGGAQGSFDIDSLPVPDRTLTGSDRSRYFIDWMKPIALMRTTVGCPFRCSFCALWRIMDGRYYKRDCDRVVAELRQIPERYVFLVDDEPFVNARRMKELAEGIAAAGIQKEYFAYCRIDSFLRDADLMKMWHDIGLRRVFFGIETIFESELRDYNKRQQLEQIIAGLNVARELGIGVFANFIIRPEYTAHEFEKIMAFIEHCHVDYPSFTILTPIPGTDATFDDVIDRQPNGRPNWDHFDLQHAVTPTALPLEEFTAEYHKLFRVFAKNYRDAEHPFYLDMARQPKQDARPAQEISTVALPATVEFPRTPADVPANEFFSVERLLHTSGGA
jgi:radical SAM superfamily enzyme YgiQ (UPF0313 family)